ncbi:MAG: YdiU family protein [Proteobacteria bacterium]|nr:YdiU family protein [Pseudomonadota bacterium]
MLAVSSLSYADRFVTALPADPSVEPRARQVHHACYSHTLPTSVAAPRILLVVPEVAALLGLDPTPTAELAEVLGGNRLVPGMKPYAACYGGHQFGTWAGQLGDGRAITLGEIVSPDGDQTWELQLKGAGPTPYSRRADGRAVLRSSLRELVCSEAMHHLGVPTTRALSLVATGDPVQRDLLYDGHPRFEPGAITGRVAPSFLRFGNFELPASRDDLPLLDTLVRFTIDTFFPGKDIAAWFAEVADRTAWMVVEWLRVGFVHGVMNTDNMSILGLTIDYGPYGWLESFDPDWTPNTTDAQHRRYRYGQQGQVALWNLGQLARAIVRIAPDDQVPRIQRTLERWPQRFAAMHRDTTLRKLGLHGRPDTVGTDDALLEGLGELLLSAEIDMTLFFRGLATGELDEAYYGEPSPAHVARRAAWLDAWAARTRLEGVSDEARAARMAAINPLYVPRNYLVHEVIEAAERGDHAPLLELVDVLRRPYQVQPGRERHARKRPEWARHKPGCSMLSCSS